MNKNDYCWDRNYKALIKHKPQIIGYIRKPAIFQKLETTYTLEYMKKTLDHEYNKYKDLINHCSTGIVFCTEPDVLKELFTRYPHYRHFYLFFPSIVYFNLMLYNFNLTSIIAKDSFKPIFGNTEQDLERNILYNSEKVDIMHNGIRIFAYKPFDKINTDLLEKVINILSRISTSIAVNLNTSISFGKNIFINDLRSVDKQIKYQTIEVLRDKAKGLPVLAVNAGPSLQTQLDYLKSIQDQVYIVAAMACYKPFLKAGIKADLYTVIDMDDIIEKYFIDVDLTGVKIVIEMSCFWGVMERHPEADYIISQASADGKSYVAQILRMLNIRVPAESVIHGGMTVAMLTLQVANLMGAETVILLGTDLAYAGTNTHLDGASHSKGVQIIKSPDNKEFLLFEDYGGQPNVAVPLSWEPGINGKPVPSTLQFQTYRNYMTMFFQNTGFKPVNCTAFGQLLPPCDHMTIQEAYDKFIKDHQASKNLDIPRHREPPDLKDGVVKLEQMVAEFKIVRDLAKAGIDEFANNPPNFDKINKITEKLLLEHTEISNNVSQNNQSGYFLYKYLELANPGSPSLVQSINNRNRARLLFGSIYNGLNLFIEEYERLLTRIGG